MPIWSKEKVNLLRKAQEKGSQLLKAFFTHQFCNVFHIISDTVRADPCSSDERIKEEQLKINASDNPSLNKKRKTAGDHQLTSVATYTINILPLNVEKCNLLIF